MPKIICSLEEWDSILNFHRPNGSSKTWYLNETKQLSIPHMWGKWNIFTEDGDMFGQGHLRGAVTPSISNLIEYKTFDSIINEPHIYIISIWNPNFFELNRDIGFSCISSKYLKDIRDGISKIVLYLPYEGYSGIENNYDFEIIEEWRLKENLPVNSIYFLNGNLLSESIVKNRGFGYKAYGISQFETWNIYKSDEIIDFKPTTDKFLFLSYNRNPRVYRVYLLWHLYQNGLFDKGLISFYKLDDTKHYHGSNIDQNFLQYLRDNTPIKIDDKYDLYYNLACNISLDDYKETFISIITESLTEENTLFFSEKIWKPIMIGHPFMLLGNPGSLKYLKELGYKTFDKWLNEDYDNEPNMIKRSQMIVEEMTKFKSKTISELMTIREEMKEVCLHNMTMYKKNFIKNFDEGSNSIVVENFLLEIWDEIKKNLVNRLI